MQEIINGLGFQCLTNWTKVVFACKSETLGSYSHALLILTKSKNQVVHGQKFKDPLTSICQFSSHL